MHLWKLTFQLAEQITNCFQSYVWINLTGCLGSANKLTIQITSLFLFPFLIFLANYISVYFSDHEPRQNWMPFLFEVQPDKLFCNRTICVFSSRRDDKIYSGNRNSQVSIQSVRPETNHPFIQLASQSASQPACMVQRVELHPKYTS